MSRESVLIVSQLSVESTRGTAPGSGANKRLPALSIVLTPKVETRFSRTNGFKTETTAVINKKWTPLSYSGPVTYNEAPYVLSALYGGSVGAAVTGAYPWTHTPNSSVADAFKTFTMQTGDAQAAQQAVYGYFASLNMTWTREEMNWSGDGGARFADQTATLTATPTLVDNIPASPDHVTCYLDTAHTGLGVTALANVFEVSVSVSNKIIPKFVLNAAFPSFAEAIEQAYTVDVNVKVEADSQQRSIYDAMLTEQLPHRFLRLKSEGLLIGGAQNHLLQGDFAVKMNGDDTGPIDDIAGSYGWNFAFRAVYSAAWGKSHLWTAKNTLVTL